MKSIMIFPIILFFLSIVNNGILTQTKIQGVNFIDRTQREEYFIKDLCNNKIYTLNFVFEKSTSKSKGRIRIYDKKNTNKLVWIYNPYSFMDCKKLSEHFIQVTYGISCGTGCKMSNIAILSSYNDSLRIVFNFSANYYSYVTSEFDPEENNKNILYDSTYDVNSIEIIGKNINDYSLLMKKKYYKYSIGKNKPEIEDYSRTTLLNFDKKKKIFFNGAPQVHGEKTVIMHGSDSDIKKINFDNSCCSGITLGKDMFIYNNNNWFEYFIVKNDTTILQTTSE